MIDTATNTVIATVPIGQGPQGVAYVPNAVPEGDGKQNLQPLGAAGKTSALSLDGSDGKPATQVTLFDQGAAADPAGGRDGPAAEKAVRAGPVD